MDADNIDEPTGADWFNDILRRPWECSALDMELKTAIQLSDVATCRELLREKGRWLAKFKSHEFAEHNHCPLIEWLLQNGLSQNAKDEFGNSALHSAVGANSVQAAALFLQMGADVREHDRNGYGLIHDVSFTEDLAMLKLLLNSGADVNDVSGGGCWPLRDACEEGNADAVRQHPPESRPRVFRHLVAEPRLGPALRGNT